RRRLEGTPSTGSEGVGMRPSIRSHAGGLALLLLALPWALLSARAAPPKPRPRPPAPAKAPVNSRQAVLLSFPSDAALLRGGKRAKGLAKGGRVHPADTIQ